MVLGWGIEEDTEGRTVRFRAYVAGMVSALKILCQFDASVGWWGVLPPRSAPRRVEPESTDGFPLNAFPQRSKPWEE